MPRPSLKFIHRFTDRNGHARHYFRRHGIRRVTLPGLPWSPEFMEAYQAAMAEAVLPLPSSLPGGIITKRRVDPDAVQPLIGVYLLLLKGKVVYIGSSLNMPNRVTDHRSNGRPFDQAFYIATKANQRKQLEATLIRIDPTQNTQYRCRELRTEKSGTAHRQHLNQNLDPACYLYRHYHPSGDLLYVGISLDAVDWRRWPVQRRFCSGCLFAHPGQ